MNAEAIAKFSESQRGPVIARDDPEYDEARKLYNGHDRQAAAADRALRRRGRRHRGGQFRPRQRAAHRHPRRRPQRAGARQRRRRPGHRSFDDEGRAGRPGEATVRVGAGCVTGDVDHATCAFGLAVPFGVVSTTGVAGLTLERRPRLSQPPIRARRRQSDRGRRCAGRRPLRHRDRKRECGSVLGACAAAAAISAS